jgi:hypothetical protein
LQLMTKTYISSWNTYHSVTKISSVTSKSSQIATFLVVKEYKPGRCKRSNKQNRRTRREKKLSHLGVDKGTKPGSDKPKPKIVRPIYVNYMHENWSWHAYRFALGFLWKKQVWQCGINPIKKNLDAEVDLPRTMMEQSEEWRNHNDRRMDKL